MILLDDKIHVEKDDLRRIFYIKDEDKEVPFYIQNAIVDLIFEEGGFKRKYNDLNDLELIEDKFIKRLLIL
ncbi:hypothetical protein [Caloramator sp. Dgby_cultured_2]|uniref:hypothetical protein n=1 Tax=Caloramator sp. Dgby_cultured_2 TaxID=3029174 RepID=UPI00237E58DD|nr:hypothetical protein [Caloramator sp. Dgby_cultured_2]WDU82998.1 hypothetical protein PWK10_16495 [Caloramator sp. Dgby_cultured_2]